MREDRSDEKLKAVTAQLIEIEEGLVIKRGRIELKCTGNNVKEILPAILAVTTDAGASRSEIVSIFAAPDRPAVSSLIDELVKRRLLVAVHDRFASDELESSLGVFYWHFDMHAEQANEKLNQRRFAIVGVNCISRQLAAALMATGIENFQIIDYPMLRNLRLFDEEGELLDGQWLPAPAPRDFADWAQQLDDEKIDCLVATADFGGQHLMREWNELCVARKCHFLPVVLQDLVGYVGPVIVPGETACYECLRARQNSCTDDYQAKRAAEYGAFQGQAAVGFHPSMASVLGDIAAIELTKFYSGIRERAGKLIEINLLATRLQTRKILKIPRCAVCSQLNARASFNPVKNPETMEMVAE